MRILHVGSGYRAWRRGGVAGYIDDLANEQVRQGHDLVYFFGGRQYPFLKGPRLRRWQAGHVAMLEVVNSPLFDHGRQPQLELGESRIERMFTEVLDELRPDVIHVHELAGLPSSLLEVAAGHVAPLIVTLHDYFPLCSTFRLFDSHQRVCLRRDIGEDCLATIGADPRDAALMFEATFRSGLLRHSFIRRLKPSRLDQLLRLASATARVSAWRAYVRRMAARPRAEAFQRRRDVNVERLNQADRLIAVSHRVREIYALLGVDAGRIVTTQLALGHIELLRPRRPRGRRPVTFATLGGGESTAKGSQLLLEAARSLADMAAENRFRLLVFGFVDADVRAALAATPGVKVRGPYASYELGEMLDEVDVGIVPSIWEEAYGLAGVEFLAKGIPLIANDIGGIVEYARDGETAWLNRSRSAAELAAIMRNVIDHPELIATLSAKIRSSRDQIIMPLARHADEMERLYTEAITT